MKVQLNHLNLAEAPPQKGDVLVIETKRNKGKKILVSVKGVVNFDGGVEIILQIKRNKYFNWQMYASGDSWVWRVWNIGNLTLTSGLNNTNLIDDL